MNSIALSIFRILTTIYLGFRYFIDLYRLMEGQQDSDEKIFISVGLHVVYAMLVIVIWG